MNYSVKRDKVNTSCNLWKRFGTTLFAVIAFCGSAFANNLQLTNISATTSTISFDISWDNSWNMSSAPSNWDAVWVVVKYQDCNTEEKTWNQRILSTTSGNHSVSGGVLQVDAVTDGMGVFIRQSAVGTGNISTSSVSLAFGTAFSNIANVNFELVGIEMVNVPEGAFYVGDGSTATPPLSQNSMGTNGTSSPKEITSEGGLSANTLAGYNNTAPTQHLAISADFPKGYAAFYCMKYEVSQNQYIQFLNLLPAAQQINRTASSVTSSVGTLALAPAATPSRNGIRIKTSATGSPLSPAVYGADLNNNGTFDEADDGGNIACNYLNWYDLIAYLDWVALRPMTELEFEKAARGPSSQGTPVVAAHVWNTTTILQAKSDALSNAGQETEVSTASGNGLCAYDAGNTLGPLRVGFAATGSTDRAGAGASYYGILDLSGNVWEQAYHIGFNSGSGYGVAPAFTGVLGDGELGAIGFADATNWGGQNGVVRSVVRGGNWNNISSYCQTSNRSFVTSAGGENSTRINRTGGRGVRQF
ncbi:MAG: SUMF1/EgtB/PvdO family nonheme iron enzyme [Bacteroidetes bacterium]|nr:SUMF1/EgtB/PvdO family nonheme iron enzyme [Bacteroidota bacterium]